MLTYEDSLTAEEVRASQQGSAGIHPKMLASNTALSSSVEVKHQHDHDRFRGPKHLQSAPQKSKEQTDILGCMSGGD